MKMLTENYQYLAYAAMSMMMFPTIEQCCTYARLKTIKRFPDAPLIEIIEAEQRVILRVKANNNYRNWS
jgi:hypothetical protein